VCNGNFLNTECKKIILLAMAPSALMLVGCEVGR
jgi:hypothetical protein